MSGAVAVETQGLVAGSMTSLQEEAVAVYDGGQGWDPCLEYQGFWGRKMNGRRGNSIMVNVE